MQQCLPICQLNTANNAKNNITLKKVDADANVTAGKVQPNNLKDREITFSCLIFVLHAFAFNM